MAANGSDRYSHVSNLAVGNEDTGGGGQLRLPSRSDSGIKVGTDTASVYPWLNVHAEVTTKGVGATNPPWTQLGATSFWGYNFDVNDVVWMNFTMPQDCVDGSNTIIQAHWTIDGTNVNPVKWQWECAYAKAHNQGAFNFASSDTFTATSTPGGTLYQNYATESSEFTLAGMEPAGVVSLVTTRITNGATDNTDGIFLLTVDVHYRSRGVGTKNAAPPYYT